MCTHTIAPLHTHTHPVGQGEGRNRQLFEWIDSYDHVTWGAGESEVHQACPGRVNIIFLSPKAN